MPPRRDCDLNKEKNQASTSGGLMREIFGQKALPLGFGSGALLSKGRGRQAALRLLETAIDCGVTYFDTARMYGAGRAEGILGEVVTKNRSRLILASKAGILPESRSLFVRAVGRGVRLLHKVAPPIENYVAVPAAAVPRFGLFGLIDIQRSIETSLRELRTDYLDIFLLHECAVSNTDSAELLNHLDHLKNAGKIRAFGIATGIEETINILNKNRGFSDVVQIPSSIFDMNVRKVLPLSHNLVVTHSSLTSRFNRLLDRLSSDKLMAAEWRSMTNIDPRDTTSLAQLLLAHALYSNPNGIVLFFSSNASNIKANVKMLNEATVDQAQIDGLNALLIKSHRTLTQV
jgi:D-threo-aldose 1-dehydrogenase